MEFFWFICCLFDWTTVVVGLFAFNIKLTVKGFLFSLVVVVVVDNLTISYVVLIVDRKLLRFDLM